MTQDEMWAREMERMWTGVGEIKDASGNVIAEAAPSLSEELVKHTQQLSNMPGGLYNQTLVADYGAYMEQLSEVMHSLHVKHNFLHQAASRTQEEGMIPIREAWNSVTSKAGKGRPALSKRGMETFLKDYAERNGLDEIPELFVPEQTSKVLQGFQDLIEPRSDMRSAFGKMYDAWTVAAKAGWTVPFPAFHTRNRIAGLFQNRVADVPWEKRSIGAMERKTHAWITGRGPAPEFVDELTHIELLKNSRVLDISERTAQELGQVAEGGLGWVLSPGKHWSLNPTKIRGLPEALGTGTLKAGDSQFVLNAIGERAYSYVETMNRVPLYLEARANGLTAAQAKALVDRVQYNYGLMTPFENKVMRRFVMPFYGWTKNNAIYHASELMQNPGGRLATTIRMASQTGRMAEGQMPRWLSEQMAIPVGGTDREQTVLRQFGLPFEDLKTFQGTSGRTMGRLIGQMHPAISKSFALYSGTDPYSGRELKHMQGPSGIPTLDALFQATPFSRGYWTYKTLTDERKNAAVKALDVLTGAKIGTYDMAKLRLLDTQAALYEQLERNPYIWQGEHHFIPPHLEEKAGPEGKKKLRQANALSREIRAMKPLVEAK
jgi:hypothetical protein